MNLWNGHSIVSVHPVGADARRCYINRTTRTAAYNLCRMNRVIQCVALVVLIAVVVHAATRDTVIDADSRYPGKCFDSRRNATYAVGAKWHRVREPCTEFTCVAGTTQGKMIIRATSCDPVARPKPPCVVAEGNPKASYPNCCNTISCPSA